MGTGHIVDVEQVVLPITSKKEVSRAWGTTPVESEVNRSNFQ